MPITLTFDIEDDSIKDQNDRARIQAAFLRFGWEHIGGSAWRYPALNTAVGKYASEDWFNHVIPALMYFRSLVEHSGMNVTKFTIDAHSEAGYRENKTGTQIGQPILAGTAIHLNDPTDKTIKDKLSDSRLRKFITDSANSLS